MDSCSCVHMHLSNSKLKSVNRYRYNIVDSIDINTTSCLRHNSTLFATLGPCYWFYWANVGPTKSYYLGRKNKKTKNDKENVFVNDLNMNCKICFNVLNLPDDRKFEFTS